LLPTPPDGLVTLDGMLYINGGTDRLSAVSIDTIIAKNSLVWHGGLQLDYEAGVLEVQDASLAWVSTGINLTSFPANAWNTFKIEMAFNSVTMTRIAFTLNGTRSVIPAGVASLSNWSAAPSWQDGVTLQLGLGTNDAGLAVAANYVNLKYTYG
jgi:hypothetical protein